MCKLYREKEVLFALLWIIAYCFVMTPLKGKYGYGSAVMMLALAVFAVSVFLFVKRNHLEQKYGLSGWPKDMKRYLYFLPMFILATGNLWDGFALSYRGTELVIAVISMILIGFIEEMIFRGIIMGSLEKSFGRPFAVIFPSILFGSVHILGMGFDPVSSIQTIIAGTAVGVMFSLAAIDGGSIWNSAIIHVFWNIVMIGCIFVVDIKPDPTSLITFVQRTDNIIITGGEFGRESGIIAIIGYIAVTAAAAYTMHRQSGDPPRANRDGEPPRVGEPPQA